MRPRALLLCAVCCCCCCCCARAADVGSLLGEPVPAADAMIEWARAAGAEVNVVVRQAPRRGRIVVAPRDIRAGEALASIPEQLWFVAEEFDEDAAPAYLWAEMRDPATPYAPYFATLPPPGAVASYTDLPESYLPLLHNEQMADAVREAQAGLAALWDQNRELLVRAARGAMTYDDLLYGAALLKTRLFKFKGAGPADADTGVPADLSLLLPVVDMADHANGCPHVVQSPAPCGGGGGERCVVWRAGADVAAGSEVCNGYAEVMLNDRAMLQYSFLQDGAVASQLSGIDRHDFNGDDTWANQQAGAPRPFKGGRAATKAELARLRGLRDAMAHADAAGLVAAISPDPLGDADGARLAMLLEWRRQRLAAIEAEIARLDGGSGGSSGGTCASQAAPAQAGRAPAATH